MLHFYLVVLEKMLFPTTDTLHKQISERMELKMLQIPVILSKETQKRIASKVGIAADIKKDF